MTGSGKTAAFVLPILHHLISKPRGKTRALVVTPTRELAAQILTALDSMAVHTPITAAAIYGGVGMAPQEHAMRAGVDVLVATPGRLLDHLNAPYASLKNIEFLVLDEADRMLDMGFLPDIKRILKMVPAKRQTLLFSATMPPPIAALTKEMLHNPLMIDLGRRSMPAVGITQAVYPVKQDLKKDLLLALLDRGEMEQALVFTRTKHRANRLAEQLVKRGIKAERIHGNRSQGQRTAALAGFKNGHYKVLVATDIAARGIDIEALGHVVNFDVPQAPDDYIHRVGRTARAGEVGDAFTFVAPDEQNDLRAIEKAIGKRLPQITIPDFDYNARPEGRLEIPIGERIAAIRGRKAEERARSKAKAGRSGSSNGSRGPGRSSSGHAGHSSHSSASSGSSSGASGGGSGRTGGSGSGRPGGSGDSRRSGGPFRSRRGR
jgi:ATP-dependent RNA helicase RhlE